MLKRSVITVLFALLVAGCDTITPPFMKNALAAPIEVSIAYTNSVETRDTWLPQMMVACGREGTEISKLTVKSDGRVIHRLDRADIAHMLRSVADPKKVVWQIQRHALVPVSNR